MKVRDHDWGVVRVARLHIDRLDQADGAVWAVSMPGQRPGYTRAHVVSVNVHGLTRFRPGSRQPKAWVEFWWVKVRRTTVDGVVRLVLE